MLCARTHFRRYQGRRVSFSCFALPDSFSAVPRVFDPIFMFCALGLFFGGTEGFGFRFHVLRAQTHFRLYGGRRVPFSCFVRPDSFAVVPRASGTFLMFCAHRFVFDSTESVRCRFHVLRARTRFRRYRLRRVPFLCFARPDSFSTVLRVSGLVFMFCAPRLIFSGTEGVGSSFHVLRSLTHFRRYRWRRVPFSRYALPDSFSAVPRASGSVFKFCTPKLIFDGTEGVGCHFHVLRS
jgi:hypothetical protein